ncbi:hypothetical protein KQ693_05750 [Thermus sp. PS18]|uniref:hypothetical protein n=1 Tax=Thermus sp. PS18 TaxID=2849039 RepID=UPI002265298B|nr:hypothetical protein [Thermus sp. PS18]UZX16533.1 hypothetical protein KQ693_05750 [Thermus sp. PS18]
MRRDWRAAWYEANPEGLVGRLRELARSRPEAAEAIARRLEAMGWGSWWELMEDLQAPRAICPICQGRGMVWAHPYASPATTPADLADEWWVDCGQCGGEGLVPFGVGHEGCSEASEQPLPF